MRGFCGSVVDYTQNDGCSETHGRVPHVILKTVTNCRDRLNFRLLQVGNLKKFWKKFPIRSIISQHCYRKAL